MSTSIVGPGIEDARSIENPATPITSAQLASMLGGGPTWAGEPVGQRSSLKIATVWGCVRILANAIATMPLHVYETVDGGREEARDHPLFPLLHLRPTPESSSWAFRVAVMTNLLLWGNAYAEIVRGGDGRVTELVPIESDRVRPFRENGELRYSVSVPGRSAVTLLRRDVLHVAGLSTDGAVGLSVISHARETLSATRAQERFTGTFYANGCRPSGVLEHPGKLGATAVMNLRESFAANYGGAGNAGKPIILEEGMKWGAVTIIPPADAQFVETTNLHVEEICCWFGVPPHLVHRLMQYQAAGTIEQHDLMFLGYSVAPYIEAIQQELDYKLFSEAERGRYCARFRTQALIRMDANARANFFGKMFQVGAMNSDEIRRREDLNTLPEARGQVHYVPSNLMPAPTPEQSDELLGAWISKGGGGGKGEPDQGGAPNPETDDKVAQAG